MRRRKVAHREVLGPVSVGLRRVGGRRARRQGGKPGGKGGERGGKGGKRGQPGGDGGKGGKRGQPGGDGQGKHPPDGQRDGGFRRDGGGRRRCRWR